MGTRALGARHRIEPLLREIVAEWKRNRLEMVAGYLTFSAILAIFPFLVFVVALAGLLIDPAQAESLVLGLQRIAPPDVARILGDRLRALAAGDSPALLTLGGLGALWVASGGMAALIDALNVAYGVRDRRPFWKVRGIAVLMTLAGAVLAVVAAAVALATPALAEAIGGPVGSLLLWLRIPVASLLMMLLLALLYYVLPDVKQQLRLLTPGSIVAVLGWVAASLAFSLYAQSCGRFEVTYGALGGVIVFLLWTWISSIVVLLGAEINAILETPRRAR